MADDITVKASIYGSYKGVEAAASFAFNKYSSLK